jgi:hypothetical protein
VMPLSVKLISDVVEFGSAAWLPFRSPSVTCTIGRSRKAARPTQSARPKRSRLTPCCLTDQAVTKNRQQLANPTADLWTPYFARPFLIVPTIPKQK